MGINVDLEKLDLGPNLDTGALVFMSLQGRELRDALSDARKLIDADEQRVGDLSRDQVWEDGWRLNADLYRDSETWMALQPKYLTSRGALHSSISGFRIFRIAGELVASPRIDFEVHLAELHRIMLFHHLKAAIQSAGSASDPPVITEIGSGPGLNLLALSRIFQGSPLIAADFSASARSCAVSALKSCDADIESMHFDFRFPPSDLTLDPDSVVITVGALEQIGSTNSLKPIQDWILRQKGVWFLHSEPFPEMFTGDLELDDLLRRFAAKRGYTSGMLPWIEDRARNGEVDKLQVQRVRLGSGLLEGYNWCLYQVR